MSLIRPVSSSSSGSISSFLAAGLRQENMSVIETSPASSRSSVSVNGSLKKSLSEKDIPPCKRNSLALRQDCHFGHQYNVTSLAISLLPTSMVGF